MTQLLLFEPTTTTPVADAVEFARAANLAAASQTAAADTEPTQNSNSQNIRGENATPGMHHMGDLARLVLMRYDLVARRRAALAARHAS